MKNLSLNIVNKKNLVEQCVRKILSCVRKKIKLSKKKIKLCENKI